MKKQLLALLALGLVLALAGCQKKEQAPASAGPNAPATVTVWAWDASTIIPWARLAGDIYMKDHPNVTVNVVDVPWNDVQQKLITGFTSGQTDGLPDVTYMQDNSMQKTIINYEKHLLPVDGKVDLSKFARFKVALAEYNGKNYAVPGDNGTTATFIRKDIVEQAGLTVDQFDNETWERFIELGRIVKAKTGIALFSTDATGPDFFSLMLQSAGVYFYDAKGQPYLNNSPVLKRTMEVLIQMYKDGTLILVPDWNGYVASINNGQAAATVQGCWVMGIIQSNPAQSGLWRVVHTPRFADPALKSVNFSSQGGSGWMVLANSKNPDVTMDFLNKTFAGSVEVYGGIVHTGTIGTWLPGAEAPEYKQTSEFFGGEPVFQKIMEYSAEVPMIKMGVYNYEARDALVKAFMNTINGADLQSALNEAQRSVEFLVNQ
ncbi:MAG: extracellular solute-binding protein [Treponema sp.]|jgi:lactose/L-arabinose transport system substrate-binding protein|nr:extracellular solute-binding protein [Treponema sp.]